MERMQMERMLATPADAEIILKLYELRTEALMRQAETIITSRVSRPRVSVGRTDQSDAALPGFISLTWPRSCAQVTSSRLLRAEHGTGHSARPRRLNDRSRVTSAITWPNGC